MIYGLAFAARLRVRVAAVLVAVLVLLLGAPVRAQPRPAEQARWVLPPVPGEKLRRLVDLAPDPGGDAFKLESATVHRDSIRAAYRPSGGGRVTVYLLHPDAPSPHHARSARFVMRLVGSPETPASRRLLGLLVRRVRSQEKSWTWKRVTPGRTRVKPSPQWDVDHRRDWELSLALTLLILLLGGWGVNRWVHRSGGSDLPRPPPPRGQTDVVMICVLFAVTVFQSWLVLHAPITGDEATNFEPGFWSHWFMAPESGAYPPLFRFLIHLLETTPDRPWLMRMPALIPGIAALWLLYSLLRRRTDARLALLMTTVVAVLPLYFNQLHEQKSYPLLLLFFLAAHRCFELAMAGDRRQWAGYSAWAVLATMTHYLAVPYLFGHAVYVAWRRRDQLGAVILAGAPAALCLLPFLVPLYAHPGGNAGDVAGAGSGLAFLGILSGLLFSAGGIAALVLVVTLRKDTRPRSGVWESLTPLLLGVTTMLALSLSMHLRPRFFYPALPLILLAVATRCPERWADWRPALRWTASVLGALMIAFGLANFVLEMQASQSPSLRRQAGLSARSARTTGRRLVVLHPARLAEILVFELRGHHCVQTCLVKGPADQRTYRLAELTVRGLGRPPTVAVLNQQALQSGTYDLLLRGGAVVSSDAAVRRWLRDHCRVTTVWKPLLGPSTRRFRCHGRHRRGGS